MVPTLTDPQLDRLREKSSAEAKFYLACRDQLSPEILVIHSIAWISSTMSSRPRNGETDFTIFDPNGGFIVVEVKGGGVGFDRNTNEWYSIGKNGKSILNESPFIQALREQKATLDQIKSNPRWEDLRMGFLPCGYGVLFPDLDDVSPILELPEAAPQIVGKRQDLSDVKNWINRVSDFWRGKYPSTSKLGVTGMQYIEEIYCKPRQVRPLISARLIDEESIRIKLTEEQSNRLRLLGRRKRAAISGGAGTGKTLLAVEKARQLAGEGLHTLLLCYNQLLGDQFRNIEKENVNLTAMNFHQFCIHRINASKARSGKDWLKEAQLDNPGADLFDKVYPYALWLSNDDFQEEKFDAIIVDEGQDFDPDFWDPLMDLLKDENESFLYIFFDSNQMIYQRNVKFPIKDEPYPLTKNCRNTLEIHNACYQYYKGELVDPPLENNGLPIATITGNNIQKQSLNLTRHIANLIVNEKIPPEKIVVLIADNYFKQMYYAELEKVQQLLPKGTRWGLEVVGSPKCITVDTVHRYKGLEATVVYLWGIDDLDPLKDRETIYVALSRPKDFLILVGKEGIAQRLISQQQV